MNLGALMLARAEEQVRARWKEPDPGEGEGEGPCFCCICDAELAIRAPRNRGAFRPYLCPACRKAGWTAARCPRCSAHLTRTDQTGPRKERRGYCKACRAAWDEYRPKENRPTPPWLKGR